MNISPRQAREIYWTRRSPQYKGDLVHRWSRSVNGKRFEFVHIVWGTGVTTFVVYRGRTTEVLHSFAR